jgi:DNA replication protein DnaC
LATKYDEDSGLRDQLVKQLALDLGEAYANCTLDGYQLYHPDQHDRIAKLRQIADQLPDMVKQGRGIVWAGPAGTGKDHMAAAMGMLAAKRHLFSVRMLMSRELAIGSFEHVAQLMNDMTSPRILIVSDPSGNPNENNLLHQLLERRIRHKRVTWLTVNAQTREQANDLLGPSVWGRFFIGATRLFCAWPDFRVREGTAARPAA